MKGDESRSSISERIGQSIRGVKRELQAIIKKILVEQQLSLLNTFGEAKRSICLMSWALLSTSNRVDYGGNISMVHILIISIRWAPLEGFDEDF